MAAGQGRDRARLISNSSEARTSFKPSLNLRDGGGGFEVRRDYGMGAVKE